MKKLMLIVLCVCVVSLVYAEEPRYVGVKECKICHKKLVEKWERTAHAKAFERIEIKNAVKEPDCLRCHVTAFNAGGYKMDDPNASKFEAVQCEACHGPGSQHIKIAKESDTEKSGDKALGLVTPSVVTCKKECHKKAHFRIFTYEEYWPLIEHKREKTIK